MPDLDQRLTLWRNTIQLFHSYRKTGFTGPFYSTGFSHYRVESPLTEKGTGKQRVPDIIAWSPRGWVVIELTCNDESKKAQLDGGKNLDPRSLSIYGCQTTLPPDTISSRLIENEDRGHCQIIVHTSFNVKNEQYIQDVPLRDALVATKDHDLSRLPEIPISIVPEMKHNEIRKGLVDIVLQIFYEKSEGKTPYKMCEEGLERLFEQVPSNARQSLVKRISQEMEILISTDLAGYIEFKDGVYRATSKFKQYPKSREAIVLRLQHWAQSPQRSIIDYTRQDD